MNKIQEFEQFLEKGGSENWAVSYKNSEGKRAYGEIERVNNDELYLKNIKLGKIERLDEKDIARFEFIPVSDWRLINKLKEGFVSYKNSKGKKAYGKLKRVGDELYLKDIKSGKRTTKIDEENIARFDFVQVSKNEIDHAKNIKKIKSDVANKESEESESNVFGSILLTAMVFSLGMVFIEGLYWIMIAVVKFAAWMTSFFL